MHAAIRPRTAHAAELAPARDSGAKQSVVARVSVLRIAAPGRVRLEIAGLYRCDALKDLIESELGELPTVADAVGSVLTGHVLVVLRQPDEMDAVIYRVEQICRRVLGATAPAAATVGRPASGLRRGERQAERSAGRSIVASRGTEQQEGAHWHRVEATDVLRRLTTTTPSHLQCIPSAAGHEHQRSSAGT
jgi:hypothetical protein